LTEIGLILWTWRHRTECNNLPIGFKDSGGGGGSWRPKSPHLQTNLTFPCYSRVISFRSTDIVGWIYLVRGKISENNISRHLWTVKINYYCV
jgi:hypothetical protein